VKRKAFASLFFLLFSLPSVADISEYIYPYRDASFSNYGTTGLIQMPSARFHPEGSIAFSWTHHDPYLRGSIIAYPFDWFEASFQYTDINNTLYSSVEAFSGSQSLKDKSFDAKFKLLKETNFFPSVAVGLRDLAGTGLFSGEYLVASKFFNNNLDVTLGISWGVLSRGQYNNPLENISDSFKSRVEFGDSGSQGGELSLDSYFGGPADIFGGFEYYLPNMHGARIKVEYDTTNYKKEGPKIVSQDSNFNFGFVYPVTESLYTKVGYSRGNTLTFGFSYALKLGKKHSVVKKADKKWKDDRSSAIQNITAKDNELLYKASLRYLGENDIFLQTANVDESKLSVTFSQSKYRSFPLAAGRVSNILDQISPKKITSFEIININADMPMHSITIDRQAFKAFKPIQATDALLTRSSVDSIEFKKVENFEFVPNPRLPELFYSFSPNLRTQIGGPDGFFFGELQLSLDSELLFKKNLTLTTQISASIVDNFDELKLASDSIIPHVRTDIVSYLKGTRGSVYVERMQLNYFSKLSENFYGKITAGLFEPMFGGVGGEILYKPFSKNYGVGIDAFWVKQRSYEMLDKFLDYETVTGHITTYYRHPASRVLFTLRGGKYLAKDSGITFDVSREFKSGLQLGIFFSQTDISSEEFGEGSFDKGFYFHIPLDLFTTNYQSKVGTWGLRPITRDGAAVLTHNFHLWGVTWAGSERVIEDHWEDFYD